jgi:hypothetical protein
MDLLQIALKFDLVKPVLYCNLHFKLSLPTMATILERAQQLFWQ